MTLHFFFSTLNSHQKTNVFSCIIKGCRCRLTHSFPFEAAGFLWAAQHFTILLNLWNKIALDKKSSSLLFRQTFTGYVKAYCCNFPALFCLLLWEKNPVPIKLGEIYHKQWADFILKHAASFFLKGHAEAQRHWPLFELVVWVFFIECVWQKDNRLSQRAIHLRFQVAPGEFNLESVGLDTSVINQLHPRVCASVCV